MRIRSDLQIKTFCVIATATAPQQRFRSTLFGLSEGLVTQATTTCLDADDCVERITRGVVHEQPILRPNVA